MWVTSVRSSIVMTEMLSLLQVKVHHEQLGIKLWVQDREHRVRFRVNFLQPSQIYLLQDQEGIYHQKLQINFGQLEKVQSRIPQIPQDREQLNRKQWEYFKSKLVKNNLRNNRLNKINMILWISRTVYKQRASVIQTNLEWPNRILKFSLEITKTNYTHLNNMN